MTYDKVATRTVALIISLGGAKIKNSDKTNFSTVTISDTTNTILGFDPELGASQKGHSEVLR